MNRSTLIVLALFIALLAVWLLRDDKPNAPEIPPLVVAGYLEGDISLQDIKVLNKDEESPYRRYELTRGGEKMVLEMKPGEEANKPAERKWGATRTKDGKTWTAAGESYRVKMLAQILARPFRSTYAFEAKAEELGDFGLDEGEAVELLASGGDRKVHLRIGKVDKSDESNASTWVQNPENPKIVYQVAGHDLRTEAAVAWKDVRERKILSLRISELDHAEIFNPRAADGRRVVKASRPPLTDDQRAKLTDGTKDEDIRKSSDGWVIDDPQGYLAGDIGSWLESVERMSMTETYDTDGKSFPPDSGLSDDAGAVHIRLAAGEKRYHIILGSKAPKGDQGDIYVAVEGDSIVYSVANWSAEQIIKDLDSLRELRLLRGRDPKTCDDVKISWAEGSFHATRGEAGWTSTDVDLDPENVDDFLRDLGNARVTYSSATDAASVGLDKPDRRITVRCEGEPITIWVKRTGDKAFGRNGDAGDVFTLQSWNADQVTKQGRDFENKHLLRWAKESITTIEYPDDAGSKTLKRGPDGTWTEQGAADSKLASVQVDALLDTLIRFSYHAEFDVDPKTVGLQPAAWTLKISDAAGRIWSLALSDTKRENNPYAFLTATGARSRLVTISAMMIEQIRRPFQALTTAAQP